MYSSSTSHQPRLGHLAELSTHQGHMEKQETEFGHGNRKWKSEMETENGNRKRNLKTRCACAIKAVTRGIPSQRMRN